ncbi:MAG TPA: hypothetical protein VIK85_00465 [Coriobacteriia bacterium]
MADDDESTALAKRNELLERLEAVRDGANGSRPGSREALRQFNREYPTLGALLVDDYGNVVAAAENALVRLASGGNVLVDETTRMWLAETIGSLTEAGDTPLEAMLAHRVALGWLAVNSAETLRARKWKDSMSTEAADFWDRHVSRVQSDFLKASRTLATVRKLRRPVLQVNVAEQQINVAR